MVGGILHLSKFRLLRWHPAIKTPPAILDLHLRDEPPEIKPQFHCRVMNRVRVLEELREASFGLDLRDIALI